MSIHYGQSSKRDIVNLVRSNDFFTTFTYPALSTTLFVIPIDIKVGHPFPVPYLGKYITKDTTMTLMEHTFDKDGAVSNLVIEYSIIIFEKDGSSADHPLGNIDVSSSMLPISTRYVSVLDKTFKISDHHANYEDIALLYVRVMKVSGNTSGNESALRVHFKY